MIVVGSGGVYSGQLQDICIPEVWFLFLGSAYAVLGVDQDAPCAVVTVWGVIPGVSEMGNLRTGHITEATSGGKGLALFFGLFCSFHCNGYRSPCPGAFYNIRCANGANTHESHHRISMEAL